MSRRSGELVIAAARPIPIAVASEKAIRDSSVVGTAWRSRTGSMRQSSVAISTGGGRITAGMRNAVTRICQISSTAPAVAIGRMTGRNRLRLGPSSARHAMRVRGPGLRRAGVELGSHRGGSTPPPALAVMALLDALAQMAADLVEIAAFTDRPPPRPGKRGRQILDDRRRTTRHDQHAVGEKHRLANAMRHEQRGLGVVLP